MKLLLTSDGLSSRKIQKEFLKLLDKPASETKVLVMHTLRLKGHIKYLKRIRRQLISLGIKKNNISAANITENIKASKFKNFDVFFSCGGNTYYILDRVRKTGFDKFIKKFVKSDKFYIGLSAGSIIIHKTIEIAGWGTNRDINEFGLRNLKGIGITNIAIFPHCDKKREKEVSFFKKQAPYPIVALKDRQALLINGKTKRLIK